MHSASNPSKFWLLRYINLQYFPTIAGYIFDVMGIKLQMVFLMTVQYRWSCE